jgi:hypothetical protein
MIDDLQQQIYNIFNSSVSSQRIKVKVCSGSVRVILSGLPVWAAHALASEALGGRQTRNESSDPESTGALDGDTEALVEASGPSITTTTATTTTEGAPPVLDMVHQQPQYKSVAWQDAVADQRSLESAGVDPVAELTELTTQNVQESSRGANTSVNRDTGSKRYRPFIRLPLMEAANTETEVGATGRFFVRVEAIEDYEYGH